MRRFQYQDLEETKHYNRGAHRYALETVALETLCLPEDQRLRDCLLTALDVEFEELDFE